MYLYVLAVKKLNTLHHCYSKNHLSDCVYSQIMLFIAWNHDFIAVVSKSIYYFWECRTPRNYQSISISVECFCLTRKRNCESICMSAAGTVLIWRALFRIEIIHPISMEFHGDFWFHWWFQARRSYEVSGSVGPLGQFMPLPLWSLPLAAQPYQILARLLLFSLCSA